MIALKNFYTTAGAAILCSLLSACSTAPLGGNSDAFTASGNSSPEAIVDAQLAAYNRRDVEGFLSYYSDDAKLFAHPNQLTESGKDQLRTRYTRSFSNQNVRAWIVKRIVFDRLVIDHERITGHPDGILEAVAVYEIKDGKIIGVTFYKP
jgi:hypothetical protein